MRALLTPVIVRELGFVILRPGPDLMHLFHSRVIIDREPDFMTGMPSGELPPARQSLADDQAIAPFFTNDKVIQAAGGIHGLEIWLKRQPGDCQWPHSGYHHHELVTTRFHPGALRLCWHCDTRLHDHHTKQLSDMAKANTVAWIIDTARIALGFDECHVVTLPELCWWATKMDIVDELPESMAHRALRMPQIAIPSVSRECDIVPELPATSIIQEKVKPVLRLKVDPEAPATFLKKPKLPRIECRPYLKWVKNQICEACGKPADDPHHLIGSGMGEWALNHTISLRYRCAGCVTESFMQTQSRSN